MAFPKLTNERMNERLTPPTGRVAAVLDTDTYNEVDDQFALAYALLSAEQIDLQAVYAAPFHNQRSSSPGDGMEKSYEEILRVMDKMQIDRADDVFKGAPSYLSAADRPVASPAAEDLVARASGVDPLRQCRGTPAHYASGTGSLYPCPLHLSISIGFGALRCWSRSGSTIILLCRTPPTFFEIAATELVKTL